MAERGWPRHAFRVGGFEFRRSVRAIWRDKSRFAFMALGVLLPSLMVGAVTVLFAESIRGVETLPAPNLFRGQIALFWLFAVFMIGSRVVSARTRIEAEPLMLTTVSARTVAGGLLVAETLRILAYLGVPVLVLTGAGVFLFGSPATLLFLPAAAVLFAATVVVVGAAFGYAVAWLVATSRFVARHKMVLGTAASLLGTGAFFLFFYPQIGGVNQASLSWLPVGWFVDLAVIGTGLADSPPRSAGVLVGSAAILLVGGAIVERETRALWFIEPVGPEPPDTTRKAAGKPDGDVPGSVRRDPLAAAVNPVGIPRMVSTPVRRVAEWAVLRTRRDPNRLMFLLIPLFAIGSPLVSAGAQSGSIGAVAAPLCAVALPWFAGSLFAMNPLGDEGAVLPVTLTAVSGRQYVRGLVVPGLVIGLPVVLVVTALAGFVSPYTLGERFGLLGIGLYLTVVSVVITPAIGMALPRFSAVSVGQSRDVLPPRMSAVGVHAALTVGPGALLVALLIAPAVARAILAGVFGYVPAILLELLSGSNDGVLDAAAGVFGDLGEGVQAVGIEPLQIVGGGGLLIGGVLVSVMLYRNAVRRFRRYAPP